MKDKYLVTGVKSGLGKYIYDNLRRVDGLHRKNNFMFDSYVRPQYYDTIIHCAFNRQREITDYYQYIDDNLFLTKKLLDLNCNRFIYISSVDVYNSESNNNYALFKKYAESVVSQYDFTLIMRLPVLLGKTMKPNHITKMFEQPNAKISLSKKSLFNYILYEDILKFIKDKYMYGKVDLVADDNITLSEIKNEFELETQFGGFVYQMPISLSNPIYTGKTSLETIKEFVK